MLNPNLTPEQITEMVFDKLEELQKGQVTICNRLTTLETKNDEQHTNMEHRFNSVDSRLGALEVSDKMQDRELHQQEGKREVFGKGWEFILAIIGGGALVAIGGWLAKLIGIF